MIRRNLLAAAPMLFVGATLPAFASKRQAAPDLTPFVDNLANTAIPHSEGWQVVDARALKSLCEAAGVEWATHYALRVQS